MPSYFTLIKNPHKAQVAQNSGHQELFCNARVPMCACERLSLTVRILVERVTWHCVSHNKNSDSHVERMFSCHICRNAVYVSEWLNGREKKKRDSGPSCSNSFLTQSLWFVLNNWKREHFHSTFLSQTSSAVKAGFNHFWITMMIKQKGKRKQGCWKLDILDLTLTSGQQELGINLSKKLFGLTLKFVV